MGPKVYVLTVKEIYAHGIKAFRAEVKVPGAVVGKAEVWADGARVSRAEVWAHGVKVSRAGRARICRNQMSGHTGLSRPKVKMY